MTTLATISLVKCVNTPDPSDRRVPRPNAASSESGGEAWSAIAETLTRYAHSLTGREDLAEDLAQRVMLRLLERRPDKLDHLGYAYTAMTRLWIGEQRKLRRRAARLLAQAGELASSARPTADRLERAEQVGLAQRRIAALSPMQRAALVLRVVEGLEYAAIAEHLGCSVGAVRANLHLARKKLREAMGDPS